jgi:glucose/mannose-6-phosphate isomerase
MRPVELDMWERIDTLPQQLRETQGLVDSAELTAFPKTCRVLVCGMGGSAAAAALIAGVYESSFETRVSRRYDPQPRWAENALVVFSSYSGNTEETLAAYERLADRCPARVVITSGGELLERARRDDVAVVTLPAGWPPRSTLGWGVGVLVRVLERAGHIEEAEPELNAAISRLEEGRERARRTCVPGEARSSVVHELAELLDGRLPFIYASDGLTEAVAQRWRAQLNENAKMLVGHALLPELDHNEVVGWELDSEARSQVSVIALRDEEEPLAVTERFDITREILAERVERWTDVRSSSGARLARAMELVQLGDYLSVVLADRHGVDPTPVEVIDSLKKRLSR